MKSTFFASVPLASALLLSALPLAAQNAESTAPHTAGTTHRPATAATASAAPRCARPAPDISAKIPAVPASAGCVKVLYTLTRIPSVRLDYASSLVSPEVREQLGSGPTTFSLDYVDTKPGAGDRIEAGKFVTVRYTGYLASDGSIFDSTDKHPNKEPFTIQYGKHRVIEGWDTGFEGMRVGGQRRLYIPWELAYGEMGHPPQIPARSELIFDIEVVSQSDTAPEQPAHPMPMRPGTMPPGAHPGAPPTGSTPPSGAGAAPGSTTPPPASSTKPQ